MQTQKSKCDHKWADLKDGTYDQQCIKCGLKQMQMVMKSAAAPLTVTASRPLMRETIEVPLYTGSEHIRIKVDKERFIQDFHREMGLYPSPFNSAGR